MTRDDEEQVIPMSEHFCGRYPTEADALEDLDRMLAATGLFRVFKEVPGYYMASRPGRVQAAARIDRILVPEAPLRAAGWTMTVGVEAKCSGEKLGPAVAQAIDYTWCVFRAGSIYLYPEWIFLWPLTVQFHGIESVMAQNRIGALTKGHYELAPDQLCFQTGSGRLLVIGPGEHVHQCSADLASRIGRKKGSR